MTNFKKSVIALAIGFFAVSCGGNSSNTQQTSGNSETAKVETKKPAQIAGSMDTLSEDDVEKMGQKWESLFTPNTGIKNIGKPKGSKIEMASAGNELFVLNFECENPSTVCASYAKAVWDLNKSSAEKSELLIYVGGDAKYKSVNSFEQTKYEDSENYTWYYYFGGVLWETNVKVFDGTTIKLIVEKE